MKIFPFYFPYYCLFASRSAFTGQQMCMIQFETVPYLFNRRDNFCLLPLEPTKLALEAAEDVSKQLWIKRCE